MATRKPKTLNQGLREALLELIETGRRGDPESTLVWTTKSLTQLSADLDAAGWACGKDTVARLLRAAGLSLQGNKNTLEGAQHPDRDAQFEHIARAAEDFLAAGDPVVSVDTKKRELVGPYTRAGQRWCPAGEPTRTLVHDFAAPSVPIAIPYGVYDIGANDAYVNVGTSADTSEFAIASIRSWWEGEGRHRYRHARRLLVCADAGGSNGYRRKAWKVGLLALARETGLDISVSHFPPGTSKWNKVEHRLFSYISINWRARLLTSYEVILDSLAATTTAGGLTVSAALDTRTYAKGLEYHDSDIKALPFAGAAFHPEWNYTIAAGDAVSVETVPEPRLRRTPVRRRKHDLRTVRDHRARWAAQVAADPDTIGMTGEQLFALAASLATDATSSIPPKPPTSPAAENATRKCSRCISTSPSH